VYGIGKTQRLFLKLKGHTNIRKDIEKNKKICLRFIRTF
jgi:hypothetical protein